MSVNSPFFSIVIPTYNRATLIRKTLESVLAQTFHDYEIIVIDDGGKDNTDEVIRSLQSEKVFYFKIENSERGAARNYGIDKSSGLYVTFLDSDDVLFVDHLETAFHQINSNPGINCYAQAYEIREAQTNTVINKAYSYTGGLINDQIIKGNILSCFGVFVKNQVLNNIRFEENRKFAGTEDWLLWLQLAARYPFYYCNRVTGAMLEHDTRSVLSFDEESLRYRTEFLKFKLSNDSVFLQKFGTKAVNKIYAHMLSYSSLHLAMSRKKKKSIQYWVKACRINLGELFTRRSLAITKKIIFL